PELSPGRSAAAGRQQLHRASVGSHCSRIACPAEPERWLPTPHPGSILSLCRIAFNASYDLHERMAATALSVPLPDHPFVSRLFENEGELALVVAALQRAVEDVRPTVERLRCPGPAGCRNHPVGDPAATEVRHLLLAHALAQRVGHEVVRRRAAANA